MDLASHQSICVAVATRDRPGYLRECLLSIACQSRLPDEVIVVDDGGSADLAHLEVEFRDRLPIRWLRQEHRGVGAARNYAARLTRSTWTCVMDDDDLMLPDRLRSHLMSVSSSDATVSYGGWVNFDDRELSFLAGKQFDEAVFYFAGLVLTHGAAMMRTDLLREHRYEENLLAGVDFDLFSRLIDAGACFVHTGDYVLLRRLHPESISKRVLSKKLQEDVRHASEARFAARYATADEWSSARTAAREAPLLPVANYDVGSIAAALGWEQTLVARLNINRRLSRALPVLEALTTRGVAVCIEDDDPARADVKLCIPYTGVTGALRRLIEKTCASTGRTFSFSSHPAPKDQTIVAVMKLSNSTDLHLRISAPDTGRLFEALRVCGSDPKSWTFNGEARHWSGGDRDSVRVNDGLTAALNGDLGDDVIADVAVEPGETSMR